MNKLINNNYSYFKFNTVDSLSRIADHLRIELSEVYKMNDWQDGMQLMTSYMDLVTNTCPYVMICDPQKKYGEKIGKGWFSPDSKYFFALTTDNYLDILVETLIFVYQKLPELEGLLQHFKRETAPDDVQEDLERYEAFISGLKTETLWHLHSEDYFYYDLYI